MKYLTLILAMGCAWQSYAQDTSKVYDSRHGMSLNLGFVPTSTTSSASLFYEYQFYRSSTERWRIGTALGVGYFNFENGGFLFDDFAYLNTRLLILLGISESREHQLELQVGGFLGYEPKRGEAGGLPSLSFGYRFRSKHLPVGFRIGGGLPDLLYIGMVINL